MAEHKKDAFDYKNATLEEIRAAARDVEERVEKQRHEKDQQPAPADDDAEDNAARVLQGHYATYKDRRSAAGRNLSSSDRWTEGMRTRKLREAGAEQHEGINDAGSRWKRSEVYTQKISEGKGRKSELTMEEEMDKFGRNDKERRRIKEEAESSKQMEHQYWLEIVDEKHRYGTNLKWYHKTWNETDTDQNFFFWLDKGDGKDLDLKDQCPRSRLEKERIAYLNAEQRQNYLVKIVDGHLRWAKNDEPVNTTKYHKDAGPDIGIVEISEEEVKEREAKEKERRKRARDAGGDVSSSESSSSDEETMRGGVAEFKEKGGTKGDGKGLSQLKARVRYYASPAAVMDRTLRRAMSNNTWLFVCDMKGNLYVGIKKTGGFQHSSFLYGARVTAAGLIKVDKGKLTSLSPLSGHYRAGTMHFKAFVRQLEEKQVDMSSVSISKSVLTIRGIEKYGHAQKKRKALVEKIKGVFSPGENKDPEEEKEEQDEKDAMLVKEKHEEHGDESQDAHKEPPKFQRTKSLPHEGKAVEELTEQERDDRGVALVLRAFERGLKMD